MRLEEDAMGRKRREDEGVGRDGDEWREREGARGGEGKAGWGLI